jgi:N-acetylmuramoyl-L-alanine amidase
MNCFLKKLYILSLILFCLVFSQASRAAKVLSVNVTQGQIIVKYTGGTIKTKSFGLQGSISGNEKLVIDLSGADLAGVRATGSQNLAPNTIKVNQFSAKPLVTRIVLEGPKSQIANFKVGSSTNGKLIIAFKAVPTPSKASPKLPSLIEENNLNLISEVKTEGNQITLFAAKEPKFAISKSEENGKIKKVIVDINNASLAGTALSKTHYLDKEEVQVAQFSPQAVRIVVDGPEAELWDAKTAGAKLVVSKSSNSKATHDDKTPLETIPDKVSDAHLSIAGSSPSKVTVKALNEETPLKYKVFHLHSPERLILDLYNWNGELKDLKPKDNPSSLILSVRTGRPSQSSSVARLVFDLGQKGITVKDAIESDKKVLFLTFSPQSSSEEMLDGLKELRKVRSGLKVVIDAGHGGYDAGAIYSGIEEKKLTLAMTKYLKEALAPSNIQIVQTRKDDQFVSLEERVNITRNVKPDLFVSIHCNAMQSTSAIHGIESYYFTPQSRSLANLLHKKVVAKTKAPDRQVRKARFVVIRETAIPSVLIETGFLSNPQERSKLIEKEYQRGIAGAIAEGIVEYLADTKVTHTAKCGGKKK